MIPYGPVTDWVENLRLRLRNVPLSSTVASLVSSSGFSDTVSSLASSGGVYFVPGFHGLQVRRLARNITL